VKEINDVFLDVKANVEFILGDNQINNKIELNETTKQGGKRVSEIDGSV
jgi:hypothetical protein